jgi:isoquinoline 1-oxidoreductase beta subunit
MISRRGFIISGAALTGGLVVAYGYVALDDGDAAQKFAASGQRAAPLNAWLKIAPDGTVICGIHRAEMGQGVTTSLAMLLAEELDADWNKVRFELAPIDRDYYNFGMVGYGQPLGDPAASWRTATGTWAMRQLFHTLGMSMTIASSSTIDAWDTLRPAGAAARQMLLAAAAREWNTDVGGLRTEQGFVIDDAGERRLSFGVLAEQASQESPPSSVTLKAPEAYRLVGHNPPRLDTPMKVTGAAEFGMDISRPDMLFATVIHSPVAGTQVASFDANGADEMSGVHAIVKAGTPEAETAVAIVADNSWLALEAAKKVTVTSAPASSALVDSAALRKRLKQLLDDPNAVVFRDTVAEASDADTTPENSFATMMESSSGASVTADYELPFLAHACMEPMNCTALYTGDALEVWAPTQANSVARDIAAKLCGLDNSQVTLHSTLMGGGFGRRADMDFIEQAVSVAAQVPGRPIKLFWSREQDIRHDTFRPAAACRMSGLVDADGTLLALDYTLATQSVVASYETRTPTPRGGDASTDTTVATTVNPPIYPVANLRVGFVPVDIHVPAGYWRSVSHSWNGFFLESFMDELAVAAKQSPLEFRRRALANKPRHLRVLNTLVKEMGKPTSESIGYAVIESHTTIVAHAVEVAVVDNSFSKVTRVSCAVDCGPVVHPDNVIAQMEGSIIDGLSAALYGNVDIDAGIARQANFDTYRRMRLAECPVIEVHLIDSEQLRPGGVGEPGVPGVAAALANAIYAGTGNRVRTLPVLSATV